jgi:FKBP-type peptidyl-prolyl cis-trans isomerase 2
MKKKTSGEGLKYIIIFGLIFALGILLVWGMTGKYPWTGPSESGIVEMGDLVTINYTGWHANTSLFDYGVLKFRPGTQEMLLKGIDEGVLGMEIGERRLFNLTPEYAFGEYNPSFLIEQSRILIMNSTITFDTTPEQFNATFLGMPEVGMIVSSVELPWRRVEILDFTNTTMTWRLMPPENHRTSWPLDCLDRNRAVPVQNDCYGMAAMNLTENGERVEIRIDPYIGDRVSISGVGALVREGNESVYYLDFNHEFAGEGFVYLIELLELEKA